MVGSIGSIVSRKCQEFLGQQPHITIDYLTRLALSLAATEAEFSQVMAVLPQDIQTTWKLLCPPTIADDGRLYVEMKPELPVTRDPLTEIDEINAKLKEKGIL